ncbi:hypothetical protein, partial [Mesonia sp.]|uniref:hypothetical protein n=1 Tax=Mesonia sp. TaxID=1960830 RepID=UPI001764F078
MKYDQEDEQFYYRKNWKSANPLADVEIFNVELINVTPSILQLINVNDVGEDYEFSSGKSKARNVTYNYIKLNPI